MTRLVLPGAGDSAAPIDRIIIEQAADWFVKLASGQSTETHRLDCQRWREQCQEHERAWQRLEGISRGLKDSVATVEPSIARDTLRVTDGARQARRRFLQGLAGFALVSGGAWLTRDAWRPENYLADYATTVGEQRTVILADGTRIRLDTASAIDVEFDERRRRVVLRGGQIEVTTGHDSAGRGFELLTEHGALVPIGTRFSVRYADGDQSTYVAVSAGTVEVRPAGNPSAAVRVPSHSQTTFTQQRVAAPSPLPTTATAWAEGILSAEHMRLDDFINELSRYRRGRLRCDPAIVQLRLTGSFPLADTDRILTALTQTLPVKLHGFTSYWITLVPL